MTCSHDCNEGRDCSCRYLNHADGGVRLHTDFSELLPAAPPLAPADRDAQQARIAVICVGIVVALCLVAEALGFHFITLF